MKMMFFNSIKLLVLTSVLLKQHSVAENCDHPIPGVTKMSTGVDITTLDLVPLDGICQSGIRYPIFNVTCLKGNKWKSAGNIIYDRPDHVWRVSSLPGGYSHAQTTVIKSAKEIRDRLKTSVSIGGGYGGFAFSASASYQKMQASVMNSSKQIEDVSSYESTIQIDLQPYFSHPPLDIYTQKYIDIGLNGTYKENKESYDEFVKLYGTHYFSRATFGGMIRSYMETDSQFTSKMTDEQIRVQAEASFENLLVQISAKVGIEKDSTKVMTEFTESTSTTIKYYGGNANLLDGNGFDKWQKTVDGDPWLFKGELEPIYKIIKDKGKKKAITIAIEQHMGRAFLTELVRIVVAAKMKHPHEVLNNLHNRINAQQNLEILDLNEVTSLKTDVEYHVMVPEWFLWNTRICLQYSAQKPGHLQCNGGAITTARKLCASPNKYTERYIDNTSKWPGGCNMQWEILSDNPPTWFRSTKMCFRWYSETGISAWNNARRGESCGKVNDLTSNYVDNTKVADDKTLMSWKIELAENSPLWLQKSKLCFKWIPDRSWGTYQCGVGSSDHEICANPGAWTAWYRDNTVHHLSGGCNMHWTWKLDN